MAATAEVARKKLTVVFAGGSGFQTLRYRRPLVGRTVRKALDELDAEAMESSSDMPGLLHPYKIRRDGEVRNVGYFSRVVLREGDILIIDP